MNIHSMLFRSLTEVLILIFLSQVYKKLWLPTNGQIEPMRIVYRMRGLLGDATEEFVESFASPNDSPEDNEKTYKLANVLVQCGGLRVCCLLSLILGY